MLNRRLAVVLLLALGGCAAPQQKSEFVGPPTEAQALEQAQAFQQQLAPYRSSAR